MVQTLGTNDTNDIYLGSDGNIVVLSGLNAVVAACETVSLAQLGEMVLATNSGIPNFQAIWVGVPNYKIWQSYLRTALLNVEGVTSVDSLTFTSQNNTLAYTAQINTIYGTSTLAG